MTSQKILRSRGHILRCVHHTQAHTCSYVLISAISLEIVRIAAPFVNVHIHRTHHLQFERVLSHLANERTWLAWVRASLTLLSNAFTIYTLYKEIDSKDYPSIHRSLRYLGMGYVVIVPITCIVGWLRFERTKYILGLTDASLHDFFGTLGVVIQAWLLGAVLCLTIGVYWNSASYYMSNLR
mmetsp:Transcript_42534/g.113590  ORF Transcript_42534/g.113590 Transcript_42534/m.113590 type:complete len:182 (+) Transcript_42534:1072-1617(+)